MLQVQLCETRRELQELKASLRVTQKEKEQLLAEKQVRQTGLCTPQPYLDKKRMVFMSVLSPEDRFIGTCPFRENIEIILSPSIILTPSIKK